MAQDDGLPAPASQSDGFFWVRAQVAVPAGIAGPLAIESHTLEETSNVQEVWVNGRLTGRFGDVPPHANPLVHPQMPQLSIADQSRHLYHGPRHS